MSRQDTLTARSTRGDAVEVRTDFRERAGDYCVTVWVNRKRRVTDCYVSSRLADARREAASFLASNVARLNARPERRRPHDRRRRVSAYLVDVTPAAPVAGFQLAKRVHCCVICGARKVANCDMGERCPFWQPRIPEPKKGQTS